MSAIVKLLRTANLWPTRYGGIDVVSRRRRPCRLRGLLIPQREGVEEWGQAVQRLLCVPAVTVEAEAEAEGVPVNREVGVFPVDCKSTDAGYSQDFQK